MTGKRNQNERKKKEGKKKSYSGYEIFISQRVPSALIKLQHLHIFSVCKERGVCLGGEGKCVRGKPISPVPAQVMLPHEVTPALVRASLWAGMSLGAGPQCGSRGSCHRHGLRLQDGCWQRHSAVVT